MRYNNFHDRRQQNGCNGNGRNGRRKYHQVRTVREREQIPLSHVARWTGLKPDALKALEDEYTDLPVSVLNTWSRLLDVPISELMLEPNGTLSEPVRQRACLLRMAKTAQTMLEKAPNQTCRYLAETMIEQLNSLMPELANVGTWPEVGKRRAPTDTPRILERVFSAVTLQSDNSVSPGMEAMLASDY